MESLPTEQNDIERLSAEPATGSGAAVTPAKTVAPESSPVTQNTQPPTPQLQFTPLATPNKPKKSHKKRNIIIAIVVLLLLAGGTVAAVMTFSTPKKDTSQKAAIQDTKPLDDAQGMITKINAALMDNTKSNYQNPQISFTSPTSSPPATSPAYQVKDAGYYTVMNQAYGLVIQKTVDTNSETGVDTVFTQGIIDEVTATFNSSQYHKTTDLTSGAEYQSDTVICTTSGSDSIPIYITCANKNAYTKVSDDLKPFAAAFIASTGDSSKQLVFNQPLIRNSSVDGYQNAVSSIGQLYRNGSGGGFFYRKGSGEWKFFKQSQSAFSCSEFNTDDLKAAFADETCMSDSNTQTTVKAYTPSTKKSTSTSNTNTSTNSTTQNGTTQNTGIVPPSTNP